jgi:hypothetical protein
VVVVLGVPPDEHAEPPTCPGRIGEITDGKVDSSNQYRRCTLGSPAPNVYVVENLPFPVTCV